MRITAVASRLKCKREAINFPTSIWVGGDSWDGSEAPVYESDQLDHTIW